MMLHGEFSKFRQKFLNFPCHDLSLDNIFLVGSLEMMMQDLRCQRILLAHGVFHRFQNWPMTGEPRIQQAEVTAAQNDRSGDTI